jgi:hypothetical protein
VGGSFELGARDLVEPERFRDKGNRVAIRRTSDATLKGTDRLGAQMR